MKASEKEKAGIRKFVCGQLRDGPDLSTLTIRILKRRYLAHVRCESLNPEAKTFMKRVVQEELVKMQENDDNGSEVETTKPQNKRKREKENDEVKSGRKDHDDESRAKKSRRQMSSSSESEDNKDCKTGSEESEGEEPIKSESEDEEQEVKKPQQKTNGISKQRENSEDSTDDEIDESEKKGNESNSDDSSEEIVIKRANARKNKETRSSSTSKGKKTPPSDEENETDSKSEKSDTINGNGSSDDSEKEEKVLVETKDSDRDSDSSSLPSLDDEQHSEKENAKDDKKKKTVKQDERKKKSATGSNEIHKAVVRLKRYISLCGLRPNYKKLLDGCRSVRSQVAVLKKELEDLGVHGQPSLKKCKTVRMKREETKELADLDVSNIIATKGRPKRRAALAWQEQQDPPSSPYLRTLGSGSDSDEENNTHRGRRRATDWANLQGIISDDADDSN